MAAETATTTTTEQLPATLQSAIETAVEQHKEGTTEAPPVNTEESPKATTEEVKPTVDDVDIEQAKLLYKALKDPTQAPIVIKFMAEQAGYSKVETKAEVKEAKGEIVDILKETLGSEFDFLAEKLAPGIERILTQKLQESQEDIRARLEEQERDKLSDQSAKTLTKLSREFFDADDVPTDFANKMSTMMDKIPPTEGMSVSDYMESIFYQVVGREGVTRKGKSTAATQEKTNKNRNDAPSRLASAGSSPSATASGNPKKMSIDEAVKLAVEQAKEKS